MAEEQRCQEGHRLCANNCGFFGSPATMNLCSKCYRDLRLNEEQALAVEKSLLPHSPPSSSTPASSSHPPTITPAPAPPPAAETPQQAKAKGRCGACGKRVGVVGFTCRCGATHCGAHRYPELHGCTFDFKAAGRDAIARDNPLVKADKLGGHRI